MPRAFQKTSRGFKYVPEGYRSISKVSRVLQGFSRGFRSVPVISKASHTISAVFMGFRGVPRGVRSAPQVFLWLLEVFQGYSIGFPSVSGPGTPFSSLGFYGIPGDLREYQKVLALTKKASNAFKKFLWLSMGCFVGCHGSCSGGLGDCRRLQGRYRVLQAFSGDCRGHVCSSGLMRL